MKLGGERSSGWFVETWVLSVNSESEQLPEIHHYRGNTCPRSHGCCSGSFLVSVLFIVT